VIASLRTDRRLATRDTIPLTNPSERISDFVPAAPPAPEAHPYPTSRSRAVTRRFDRAELEIARALADAASSSGALADRDHEVRR
jgi:hypothetical protein